MIKAIEIYYRLRGEVDSKVAVLEKLHGEWMACRKGCCSCCLNLSVWPVEFYAILEQMKTVGWPRPVLSEDAKCDFLDGQGGCQIYPFRPIICRTHGLPLVYWHEETDPPGWGVMYCEKNFTKAEEIDFGPDTTLNMDEVNEKLARINIDFLEERKDLDFEPINRVELSQLLDYL